MIDNNSDYVFGRIISCEDGKQYLNFLKRLITSLSVKQKNEAPPGQIVKLIEPNQKTLTCKGKSLCK